ncbi:hypothetical protein C8D87_105278 [Lentzea atacamensis]|uniref:Uncharacterized protein n=1 Tax=Lentzea atacamensis TaxID=531938 RepID=A0ABX9E9Q6_9PSEU|nr:hypothetical protein [Lentzea atacamensis]RAS64785.1 hypothetical protein C8D87_105278 [Lentzea atacamensis]
MIQIGDEQIYRQRDQDPSQRVRVVSIDTSRRNPRYEIEFLDGERAGKRENVPERRLRGPWSGVRQYDENVANWERVSAFELTDVEESAVELVFEALIPEEVANRLWNDNVTEIADPVKLEALIGSSVTELVERVESLTNDEGNELVSPEGTLIIAELACTVNPMPVLTLVLEEEREYREKSKHGWTISSSRGEDWTVSPERMYSRYLESIRPLHELLRGWCGHRAVSLQERLGAAEAEVRRLDLLVTRLVDELRENGHSRFADVIAEVHEEERITPANFRPVVDRPLKPSEIPVRYIEVPRRRRWG